MNSVRPSIVGFGRKKIWFGSLCADRNLICHILFWKKNTTKPRLNLVWKYGGQLKKNFPKAQEGTQPTQGIWAPGRPGPLLMYWAASGAPHRLDGRPGPWWSIDSTPPPRVQAWLGTSQLVTQVLYCEWEWALKG